MTVRVLLISFLLFFAIGEAFPHVAEPDVRDTTKWYNKVQRLQEVKITTNRKRYSRRNNPAVELMRKVIAAKRRNSLSHHDYCSYDKYQKLTLAVNDANPKEISEGILGRIPNVYKYIELCHFNNKLILPMMVTETVTKHLYRREPMMERDVVAGEREGGVCDMFESGELLVAALKDFFTDVDIYDDQIRLLQHPFTSPISKDAIGFYRFYITDTLNVGADRCVKLSFVPNHQQDFGFSGDIFILADSSYQVRRCEMTIPKRSDVNFVDGMRISQEFGRLPNGEWTLTQDDMLVEMKLFDFLTKGVVIRNTRLAGHSFDEIPDEAFALKSKATVERQAKKRDADFWLRNRPVPLTRGEEGIDAFMDDVDGMPGVKVLRYAVKLLVDNYVGTSRVRGESKFDIGPVLSTVSTNFIDGLRTRIGGQTTAMLNPHLFADGYYAHGWKSRRDYYNAALTYSFNAKENLPRDYPMRNVTFSSAYDVGAPSDKFLTTDKDNVFTSLKWTDADKMMFYNRQQLKLQREDLFGLRTTLSLTAEEDEACGSLRFARMADAFGRSDNRLRTTELRLELRYAPGEKFVSTKQTRRMLNLDAPVLTVSHSMGFDGPLGGQYRYNVTEMSFFKRFWAKSWGKVDATVAAGAQWNRVPFPLLIMPAANLSYIVEKDMFNLMNNMEFLNDRYVALHLSWDINGKLLNRIPLVNRLKWREYIGVKALWGGLTDKNNPMLPENASSKVLMRFPEGSYVMESSRPYVEVVAGVHNVFRFLHIEYVRRLTYLNLPTAHKHGLRFKVSVKF